MFAYVQEKAVVAVPATVGECVNKREDVLLKETPACAAADVVRVADRAHQTFFLASEETHLSSPVSFVPKIR